MRQTCNKATTDWIGDRREYNRDSASLPAECGDHGRSAGQDHIGLQVDQLFGECRNSVSGAIGPAILDSDVSTLHPTEPLQLLLQRRDPGLFFRTATRDREQHANVLNWVELLSERATTPRYRTADKRYEFAPLHSTTSSEPRWSRYQFSHSAAGDCGVAMGCAE